MTSYGLIGYPLGHSFSPAFFEKKFTELGLNDHVYKLFEIRDLRKLRRLLDGQPELKGFNVTIPYKKEIIGYLNELHDSAVESGSVNVVKITGGKLKGYNTDRYGVEKSLLPCLIPGMKQALILGTGGSANTVASVLRSVNIECQFASRKTGNPYHLRYDQLNADFIGKMDVIVNTTPVGMFPESDKCPAITYEALHPGQLVFDLIYNPEQTLFLKKASEQGASTLNGLQMLYAQAEKAWEIWRDDRI